MPYYFGSNNQEFNKKNVIKTKKTKKVILHSNYKKQNSFYYSNFYFILRAFLNFFQKKKFVMPFEIKMETIISILFVILISGGLFAGAIVFSDYLKSNSNENILKLPYNRTYNSEIPQNLSTSEIKNIYLSAGGEDIVLTPIKYFDYQVSAGDSLWTIAKKFQVSVDSVYSANMKRIKNPHILTAGVVLRIPSNMGIVKEISNINDVNNLLDQFDIDELSLLIANGVSTKEELIDKTEIFLPNVELPQTEKLKAYGIAFGFPTRGYVSSRFGYRKDPFTGLRRFHTGLDISNVWGTSIYAAYDGTVIFVGEKGGYGLCIIISHPLGYSTLYGHLSNVFVKVGQKVSKGSKIAAMGSSGRSTGSHLHFEIRKFGKFLNPLSYTIFK